MKENPPFCYPNPVKYKLLIQYDGTHFAGWQVQPNAKTIQEEIEKALQQYLQERCPVVGSGRTDAGVHAFGQVAHFSSEKEIDLKRLLKALSGLLPHDIRILELTEVDPQFHARYSAKGKIYHYRFSNEMIISPFERNFVTHVKGECNIDLLKKAARHFIGTHDFTSFSNQPNEGACAKGAVRTLTRLDIVHEEKGIRLEFEANGFLYKMVRNITGTLLDVAAGKLDESAIPEIFEAKDRKRAGKAAPAKGLVLFKVHY